MSKPDFHTPSQGNEIALAELAPAHIRDPTADLSAAEAIAVVKSSELESQTNLPESQADPEEDLGEDIDSKGLWLLSALHFSSTWGDRCLEFGAYLFLIEAFKNTLLAASIFGFCTTGAAILFSGSIGQLLDAHRRLPVLRTAISLQKASAAVCYGLFLVLFLTPSMSSQAARGSGADGPVWAAFTGVVLCGIVLKLATIGVSVSIERDWATTIGQGGKRRLMKLNTWLRRIDLVCKLVAPLFVSALTAGVSYSFAAALLCGMSVVTLFFEIPICGVVYSRFPALEAEQAERSRLAPAMGTKVHKSLLEWLDPRPAMRDWAEFSRLPVFLTSLSISSVYLTVLSFDGTFLSYLKSARSWDDPFIAGMRAICAVTGLVGTVLLPFVERKLGLIRAGSWSIWSEIIALIPVVIALYVGAPDSISKGPAWNSSLLFGGMAASRIGLWMFDLAQVQILQEALEDHPRRNALTALQYSLQNTFDMLKYVLTMILSNPKKFKWAGLVSWMAVFVGGCLFVAYVRRVRGHLVHSEWAQRLLGGKKNQ